MFGFDPGGIGSTTGTVAATDEGDGVGVGVGVGSGDDDEPPPPLPPPLPPPPAETVRVTVLLPPAGTVAEPPPPMTKAAVDAAALGVPESTHVLSSSVTPGTNS
jgi:hypothetical protein